MKVFLCATILLLCATTPAYAQDMACGPHDEILAQIAKKYNESPIGVGMGASGVLLELLASPDGSTWTIVVSQPGGGSCLLAAGESWQHLDTPTEPPIGDGI